MSAFERFFRNQAGALPNYEARKESATPVDEASPRRALDLPMLTDGESRNDERDAGGRRGEAGAADKSGARQACYYAETRIAHCRLRASPPSDAARAVGATFGAQAGIQEIA